MSFQHLQFIYARSVPLNYVSPPICEGDFSSTGEPVIILASLARLRGPSGLIFGGSGGLILSWDNYPGAICYNVYKLVDELDPFGPYELIAECISDNFLDLTPFGPGTYKITVITPNGETEPTEPIVVPPTAFQLSITTSSLMTVCVGEGYFQLVEATGGVPGGFCGYTWAVIDGSLPMGLSLDSCSGIISGSSEELGVFPITIEVQDGNATMATRFFRLVAIEIANTTPFQAGELGQGVSFVFYLTDFPGLVDAEVEWQLASGEIPLELALAPDGTMSGILTQEGDFTFVLSVSVVGDGFSAECAKEFTATVLPQPPPRWYFLNGFLLYELFAIGGFTQTDTGSQTNVWRVNIAPYPYGVTVSANHPPASPPPIGEGHYNAGEPIQVSWFFNHSPPWTGTVVITPD